MSTATSQQTDYILSLAGVRFLSEVPGLSQRQARGGLTKSEASQLISTLLAAKEANDKEPTAAVKPDAEPAPFTEGVMPAAAVLDALDKWVTLTTVKTPGSRTMRLNRVERHSNGSIVLVSIDKTGRTLTIAIQNVTSWRVEK